MQIFIDISYWTQPMIPSNGKEINNLGHIYSWVLYSSKKEKEKKKKPIPPLYTATQMNYKWIMLSERCQSQMTAYCMLPIRSYL